MIKRFLRLLLLLALLPFFTHFVFSQSVAKDAESEDQSDSRPWFKSFVPLRQFYVSPAGNGDGKSADHPMSFAKALDNANPGDLYWLQEGTYRGTFQPSHEGTEKNPIVFRAVPGKHVIIEGGFQLTSAYNWLWGFEITDPQGKVASGGAEMLSPGIRLINNVIHDQFGKIGVGAWQQGKGQVVYGNVIYKQVPNSNNPHNLYAQNDFASWGYKYIVNNFFLDASEANENTFNVHCYTEGGLITGLWFEKNFIKNGKFLIGGFNAPAERNVVKENYFYKSLIQFGYRRPTQIRFLNNYVARTPLVTEWFWGAGETSFKQTAPSVYTGNEMVNPPGPHVRFSTSAYLSDGRCEGCSRIRSNDVFDQNRYTAPFRATFFADSKNLGLVDLATWRRVTAQAGSAFDTNSVEIPPPNGVKTVIVKNDYDPLRAHMAVYNWSGAPRVRVDLGSYLSVGTKFAIFDAKQIFQTPVFAGVYSGPFEITSDREFRAFIITRQ